MTLKGFEEKCECVGISSPYTQKIGMGRLKKSRMATFK